MLCDGRHHVQHRGGGGGLQACKTLLIKELASEMSVFILTVAYLLNVHQWKGERDEEEEEEVVEEEARGAGVGWGGGCWLTVLQPYFLSRLSAM